MFIVAILINVVLKQQFYVTTNRLLTVSSETCGCLKIINPTCALLLYNILQIQAVPVWYITTCLVWYGMPHSLSLYHWTDEISSRKLGNRAFHLAVAENSSITEPGLSGGKNSVWTKPPLKMDLVKLEKKHIPKPSVHWGNNNSPNNNDHELLNMAEWWQDFLSRALVFQRQKGRVCVMILTEQRGDYLFY